MKKLRYGIEYLLLLFFESLFRVLPLDSASALGGTIARTIGLRLATNRKAYRNLDLAMPGLSMKRKKQIVKMMWDNLGRVIAEYPHLKTIAHERVEYVGLDVLEQLKAENKTTIFFAAHLANWEMAAISTEKFGIDTGLVYRPMNNPWTDRLLGKYRSDHNRHRTYPKSTLGMRALVQDLKQGKHAGILIDQKYNEGIIATFFGKPCMTSPAFVQMAQKYDCALVPVRSERLGGAHFRITFYPELSTDTPLEDVIASAHTLLEDWIRDRPGQWIWLHRRWESQRLKRLLAEQQ